MDHPTAGTERPGVVVIDVDRIVVAGQIDESGHVTGPDDPFDRRGITDPEVLELPGCGTRHTRTVPATVSGMPPITGRLTALARRVETEAQLWWDEPIRRVAIRNRPLRPWRQFRFHHFGEYSFIDRPAWLYGPDHISIGTGVMILEGAWLAVERIAWGLQPPVISIGDRVAIRVGSTISAAESIVIEDDVGMGAGVSVIDSKHTWAPGRPNPLWGPIQSAPIHIGRGTWLADRVTIAAGADIGQQCAIGPGSVVSSKIADYSVVMGNPGRVVGSTRV